MSHLKEKHETTKSADDVPKLNCNNCESVFDTKNQLSEHMLDTHNTGENIYTCDKCDFAATSWQPLQKHVKDKHECITLYLCEFCEFECINKNVLKDNLSRKHSRKRNEKSKQDNLFEFCQ